MAHHNVGDGGQRRHLILQHLCQRGGTGGGFLRHHGHARFQFSGGMVERIAGLARDAAEADHGGVEAFGGFVALFQRLVYEIAQLVRAA